MTDAKNNLDPRLTPARGDIASLVLKGVVEADSFVKAVPYSVINPLAPLHSAADKTSRLSSQLLFGDAFEEFEQKDGWSWGQSRRDGYVGYVPSDALGPEISAANRRVAEPTTHIYETADLKSPIRSWLPMGATVCVQTDSDSAGFVMLENLGWVFQKHLQPLNQKNDPVETARAFLGSPYLWGGCSTRGLDCSALMQIAALMAGKDIPRDTDLQEGAVGTELSGASSNLPENLQRGDLVFFPCHVGIMENATQMIHANAFHMKTVSEPLEAVIERLRPEHVEPVTSVRRPDF